MERGMTSLLGDKLLNLWGDVNVATAVTRPEIPVASRLGDNPLPTHSQEPGSGPGEESAIAWSTAFHSTGSLTRQRER